MAANDSSDGVLTITPSDRDAIIRTVIGEAGNQSDLGKAAVAHVIMNRTIDGGYGDSPTDVVTAPKQFEPWQTRAAELSSISPNSPQYQQTAKVVDGVLAGDTPDPTNGATHFLNPDIVMQRSGRLPKWAQGDGVQIGQHVFLGGQNAQGAPAAASAPDASSAIASATGASPQAGQGTVPSGLLAFASDGLTPAVEGKPLPQASKPSLSAATASMSDADLEALITGKPASASPAISGSVSFADPKSIDPSSMSDADLEKMIAGSPAQAVAKAFPAGGSKAPLTPQQVATGRDPATNELVVGGKPFTSDGDHWNALTNMSNGALQGAGIDLMAGVQALKAKLYDNDPQTLGNLYDQAKSTYQGARQDYASQNPLMAASTEAGGSLATALPTLALGGAGIAGAGNALIGGARSVPALARLVPAAEGVGNFLTGGAGAADAAGQGGNLLLRGGSLAASGASQGAAAGALTSGLSDQPVSDQIKQGVELGAGLGVGAPIIYGGLKAAGNKLLGAANVSPETAQLARTAQSYGIPLRPGQITDSPGVRYADSTLSKMPGMGYAGDQANQATAFNRAVSRTIGEDADRITPELMTSAKTRIGKALDDVASQTTIRHDLPMTNDLVSVMQDAKSVLADSEFKPLQTQVQNILSKFSSNGEMTGDAYQALTRNGSPLDRLQNSNDSNLKHYAGLLRDTLDDALERSASPNVLGQLQQARGQYKAMKTIEPLVAKSQTGSISPAALQSAVSSRYNMAYAGGGGALGDLARIGQKFLKEPPSSGTSERLGVRGTLGTLGSLGGAAVGLREAAPYVGNYVSPQTILPTLATMAGTFGAGRVASQVLRSPTVANMLLDSATGVPSIPGPTSNLLLGSGPGLGAIGYNRVSRAPPGP